MGAYNLIVPVAEVVQVQLLQIERCGEVKKLAQMVNISLLYHRWLLKSYEQLTNGIAVVSCLLICINC